MKYPCIESTLDIFHGTREIRLWINQTEVKDFYEDDTLVVRKILNFINEFEMAQDATNEKLVEFIKKNIKGANAVHIRDKRANVRFGMVVYFVDFEQHG